MDTMYEIVSGDMYNQTVAPKSQREKYHETRENVKVSDQDYDKLTDLGNEMTPEMMDEIIARRTNAINKLYDLRTGMQGDDQDKLDTLAATSDEAQDYNTIQSILTSSMMSKKYNQLQDKMLKQMAADPELAKRAELAYNTTENGVNNKYTESAEGQKVYNQRMKEQAEKSKQKYLKGKYTHPGK